ARSVGECRRRHSGDRGAWTRARTCCPDRRRRDRGATGAAAACRLQRDAGLPVRQTWPAPGDRPTGIGRRGGARGRPLPHLTPTNLKRSTTSMNSVMNNALAEQRESHRPKGAMMRVRLKADGRIVEILADGSERSLQRAPANSSNGEADAAYAR